MAPQLKVLLPAPGTAYPPTLTCPVNSPRPIRLKTDHFDGEISIWVKNYNGLKKAGDGHEFFGREDRKSITYALIVRGRFLTPISSEELEFGNVFEEEIASKLPWGSSIVMRFINYVDPNVKIDAYSPKPWALSPVLASMNHLSLRPISPSSPPTYPSATSTPAIVESAYPALEHLRRDAEDDLLERSQDPEDAVARDGSTGWGEEGSKEAGDRRKKWFGRRENRETCMLDETVEVGMEFGNGLLDFSTLSVVIPPPFSFHINLTSYWDGQPATYSCCSKDRSITFWSMAFQIHDIHGTVPIEEQERGEERDLRGQEDEEGNPEGAGGGTVENGIGKVGGVEKGEEREEGIREKGAIVEKMDKVDKRAGEEASAKEKSDAIDTAISEDID